MSHGGAIVFTACGFMIAANHFLVVGAMIHAVVLHSVMIHTGMHVTILHGLMRVRWIHAHVAERRLQRLCCEQYKNG